MWVGGQWVCVWVDSGCGGVDSALRCVTCSCNLVQVWDLKTSKCVAVLKGHVSAVTSIGFSEDRKLMIRSETCRNICSENNFMRRIDKQVTFFKA